MLFIFQEFDNIKITDRKVPHLCSLTNEPSPYAILVSCLKRNNGLGDTTIYDELLTPESGNAIKRFGNVKNQYIMRVGNKEVKVWCKNKKDGKQFAAQQLLVQLHPHLKSWGSILRLYGSHSIMSQKAKREKEAEVIIINNIKTNFGF